MREDESWNDGQSIPDSRRHRPRGLVPTFSIGACSAVALCGGERFVPLARREIVTDEPEQPVAGVRIRGEVRHIRKALHQRAALLQQLLLQRIDIGPAAEHVDALGEILLFERGVEAHEVAAQPLIESGDRIRIHLSAIFAARDDRVLNKIAGRYAIAARYRAGVMPK